MSRNMGWLDRILRFFLAFGMLSMILFVPESGYWGLLGLAPLLSGIFGYCPAYQVFGIRTTDADREEA